MQLYKDMLWMLAGFLVSASTVFYFNKSLGEMEPPQLQLFLLQPSQVYVLLICLLFGELQTEWLWLSKYRYFGSNISPVQVKVVQSNVYVSEST